MYRISICVLCSILFVTNARIIPAPSSENPPPIHSVSQVKDCFYINNNTESIQLVCHGFNGSYPKSDCFTLFSNTSDESERDKIKMLKTGNCQYDRHFDDQRIPVKFSNLRELDTSYSGMHLRLMDYEHLEILNASYTYMQILYHPKLPSLRELDLSSSSIFSISDYSKYRSLQTKGDYVFDFMPELRILNLSNNDINSIGNNPFKYNRKLEILRLENNPIKSFDCSLQSTMKSASVSITLNDALGINLSCLGDSLQIDLDSKDDVIFRVPQSKSELRRSKTHSKNTLTYFNISGNALENAVQVIESLESSVRILDVSSNSLAALNMSVFDRFVSLDRLVMSNTNQTSKCLDTLQHFASINENNELESFYLEKCPIKRFDCHLFSSMKSSLTVQVSCDQVEEIDTSCMGNALEIDLRPDNHLVFRLSEKKSELRCSESGLDNIKRLNVSGNEIKIGAQKFIELLGPSIIELHLFNRNNEIKAINCKILSLLSANVYSNISWDNVKEVNTGCLGRSLKIDVSRKYVIVFRVAHHNNDLNLSKKTFNKLTHFNISGNQLGNVAEILKHLGPSIEILDLASNRIAKITERTFNRFVNLTFLNLSQTNLLEFEYRAFNQLKKLNSFDLSYNQLKKVNFAYFKELTFLNLEGNNLTEINTVTRTVFPKLSTLGISKNDFSCDYLASFTPKWSHIQFIHNPSNQIHIYGVDCRRFNLDAEERSTDQGNAELMESTEAELLVWKCLFLLMVIFNGLYLVVKLNGIQFLKQNFLSTISYISPKINVAYRKDLDTSSIINDDTT